MKIASWNVRTLLDREGSGRPERRTALVAAELERYQIELAALQETRWLGAGELRERNYTFFWSGRAEGARRDAGVAFAVSNRLLRTLASPPQAHSDRLISLRAGIGGSRYVTFVCAYAPTLGSSEEAKIEFYQSLHILLGRLNAADKLVMLGDFNARVGCDSVTWGGVLGRFGRGNMNENGLLLATVCVEHGLAITNTFFRVPEKWYGSWQHPRSKHVHLLDYILTKRRDISDFHSTRVVRGAECGSDHYMVRSVVAFRLKRAARGHGQKSRHRLNLAKLRNADVRREFQAGLAAKLDDDTQPREAPVDVLWQRLSCSLREVAVDVLGTTERRVPDWFSENEVEIRHLIDRKNMAYAATLGVSVTRRLRSALTEARRVLQRRLREIRDAWWLSKANELQRHADAGDFRSFYAGLKEVYGPLTPAATPVASRDGTLLTSPDDIRNRWRQYYEQLLNCDPTAGVAALDAIEQLPVRDDLAPSPTLREVEAALVALKDGKAAGGDGVPGELLKYGGVRVAHHLVKFFTRCWETGSLPQDFKDARIVSIYKKVGDRHDCGNYRGISLLSVAGKVLARLMLMRLQGAMEDLLPESQCGFRQGRATVDMVFTLRQLQEKAIEQRRPLYIVFVDFRKAFDTVDRETLWKVLERFGCPDVFLEIVKQFHDGMSATVIAGGSETDPFTVRNGVRQGCVLAPSLFSLFLTAVLASANLEEAAGVSLVSRSDGKLFNLARLRARTKVRRICVRELLYADDAALVANSLEDLQDMARRFAEAAQLFGLQINTTKTEVMFQPVPGEEYVAPRVSVGEDVLRDVTAFKYLGSTVTNNNSVDTEITRRIQAACAAFGKLRAGVWSRHSLKLRTKLALYRAVVIPTLTYSLEACVLYSRHVRKLVSVQLRHLRQLLGFSWRDFVPNVEVFRRAGMPSVEALLVSANIRWAGHVVRMDDDRLPRAVMYGELSEGSRTVGGQKLRFKDVLKRNLKAANMPVDDWEELAECRSEYRQACVNAVDQVERRREAAYEAAQSRRHHPPPAAVALQCPHCEKICRGRVGLATHIRTRHRQV